MLASLKSCFTSVPALLHLLLLLLLLQRTFAANTGDPGPSRQRGRPASDSPPGQPGPKDFPHDAYSLARLWTDYFRSTRHEQAPTYAYKDLHDFGWVQQPYDAPRATGFAEAFLHGLGLQENPPDVKRMCYTRKANDVTLTGFGSRMTNYRYDQFVTVLHGVIAILSLSTPQGPYVDEQTAAVGDPADWQNFMPVLWQEMCSQNLQENLPCSELQWVGFMFVDDSNMLAIMHQALGGTWDKIRQWPGTKFPISTEQGKALLGSPYGQQVARLISAHRHVFNGRTVGEAIVYSPNGNGRPGWTPGLGASVALAFQIVESGSLEPEMSSSGEQQHAESRAHALGAS